MNRKQFLKLSFVLICILFFSKTTLTGQVTIGNEKKPENFSVLEVSTVNVKGGLRLPQLSTTQRDALSVVGKSEAAGLLIFNTTTKRIEYWDGSKWISLDNNKGVATFTKTMPSTEVPITAGSSVYRVGTITVTQAGKFSISFWLFGGLESAGARGWVYCNLFQNNVDVHYIGLVELGAVNWGLSNFVYTVADLAVGTYDVTVQVRSKDFVLFGQYTSLHIQPL